MSERIRPGLVMGKVFIRKRRGKEMDKMGFAKETEPRLSAKTSGGRQKICRETFGPIAPAP